MMDASLGRLWRILVAIAVAEKALVLAETQVITIGGVLSSQENVRLFHEAVEHLSSLSTGSVNISFNSTSIIMDSNPIRSALDVCDHMIPQLVHTIIASHPAVPTLSPVSVSYTCGFYGIPLIGISARDSAFSDKNVHPMYLRTVPPYFHQADVWVDILGHYGWRQIIFIHSMDEEGRTILSRFQTLSDPKGIQIEKIVKYPSGIVDFTASLEDLPTCQSRVVLLYALKEDAERLFAAANRMNLTGSTYAWIVTEQALAASNIPLGALGLELYNGTNEEAHIKDAVSLVAQTMTKLFKDGNLTTLSNVPLNCRESSSKWHDGQLIYKSLLRQRLDSGVTGQVSFNSEGDRLNPVYWIKNVQQTHVNVGFYGNRQAVYENGDRLQFGNTPVLWPGGETAVPKGIKITTHLKVVTILATPFVDTRKLKEGEICDQQHHKSEELPCPHTDSETGVVTPHCCWGYCMDMLFRLAREVNFTFDIHLSGDNSFGSFERNNITKLKKWNGMIGELLNEEADMIVAPLTINPERSQYIDFSKPFKYHGLTILVKKTQKDSSLGSFLQPFQNTLWILVGLSVHVVALVLYLLDRFSPFGRFKLAKSDDTEEDALNLSTAVWFAWGVLLNSGIGEGTPRSFSARVLGMVWAGFAMIIVASYTANLAAFLVLDRPEASITGIDDARLRNPNDKFIFATVKKSAVEMYFKRQVELSTMYRKMEERNENITTAEEAIQQVKDASINAFIWDSSRLEYEAAHDCDLVTAGDLFGRSGLGIGLKKNSLWTHKVSLAILTLHEAGTMEELDNKWIFDVESSPCPERDSAPATLGLTNMAGVFMMVAGGIVAGVLLIFVEIAYERHRGLKEKELELARNAADRWRGNIEKRKKLRETWAYLRCLKAPNSSQVDNEKNELDKSVSF